MFKFIRRLFNELARRRIDLEAEIMEISNERPHISDKDFIGKILHIKHPHMFSVFEIDYTMDRMVRDGRLVTNGKLYVSPKNKSWLTAIVY